MSAEDLGRRLVGEIKSQRLDEFLTTLSLLHTPSPPTFNIPPLDRLLSIFTSQPTTTTGLSTPNPPILEVTSPTPSQGPLLLLYLLTAISILPNTYGGKEGIICVIDPSLSFSIPNLTHILRHKIQTHNPTLQDEEVVNHLLKEALNHLHIFKPPENPSQLLSTISSIPDHFLLAANHTSNHRVVSAILLPSLNSFHYQDRANMDTGHPSRYPEIITAMRLCGKKLRAPVVCGTWNLGASTQGWSFRTQVQAELGVVVRRVRRRYAAGICADEVLGLWRRRRERLGGEGEVKEEEEGIGAIEDLGKDAKEAVRFEVRVNGWGSEDWDIGIGDALRRHGDGFFFRCEGGGVVIEG